MTRTRGAADELIPMTGVSPHQALARAASGAARGAILVRRGGSLHIAGRYDEARADLSRAITLTRRSGEVLWEARARTAAALVDLAVGATARAEAGFGAAESLFAGPGSGSRSPTPGRTGRWSRSPPATCPRRACPRTRWPGSRRRWPAGSARPRRPS